MARRGSSFWGLLMILAGSFIILKQFNLLTDQALLYFIALAFIGTYLMRGGTARYSNLGMLIPGCMIGMIALYADVEDTPLVHQMGGGFFFILLSFVFFVVLIHTWSFRNEEWGRRNWPIFPATSLLAFGLLVMAMDRSEFYFNVMHGDAIFGVLIIALGFYILFRGGHRRSKHVITIQSKRTEGSVTLGDDGQERSE